MVVRTYRTLAAWALAAVLGAGLAAGPVSRPAPSKPGAPDAKAVAAMNAAVADLLKEAKSIYAPTPSPDAKPRGAADYFPPDAPPDGITPAAILSAIERPVDRDPRVDCYVKWQLLSGMPSPVPPELLQRLMVAYRRAPEPFDHPGLNRSRLSAAVFKIGVMHKEALPKLKEDYDATLAANKDQNYPILRYRETLFSRLPPGADAFFAAINDLAVRTRHGVPSYEMWDQIAASIKAWTTVGSPDQRECAALAKALNDLKSLEADPRYQVFVDIEYHDQGNDLGLTWKSASPVDQNSIQTAIDTVKSSGRSNGGGGGGLNFKDDKK